ncbi:MAG: hypothetical protein ABI693_01915 [Bryobacteraceae bacterium]
MKVEFVPLSPALLPACAAFNQRLRERGEFEFYLPEEIPVARTGGIAWTHYVAVDERASVRGGVLLMEQRGWLNQTEIPLVNIQSPLSEGIVDKAWSGVGLRLLQFLTRRSPYVYAIGMGGLQHSFPRLLAAAGWEVRPVPFQFAVLCANRFLREIGPLRQGSRRIPARLLASTGLGATANFLWRAARRRPSSRGVALEKVSQWPDGLDEVWKRCRQGIGFSSVRDAKAAADLYPEGRIHRFVLRVGGEVVGWSACLVSPMQNNAYFGNLVVGTVLDALAPASHLSLLLSLTTDVLASLGADLVVTNQTHSLWREHFRRLGYVDGPSNYLLALSKPLKSGVLPDDTYVSRGDGDGRINL